MTSLNERLQDELGEAREIFMWAEGHLTPPVEEMGHTSCTPVGEVLIYDINNKPVGSRRIKNDFFYIRGLAQDGSRVYATKQELNGFAVGDVVKVRWAKRIPPAPLNEKSEHRVFIVEKTDKHYTPQ